MASFPAQVVYQLVVNHMAPLLASSVAGLSSSYFSSRQAPIPTLIRHEMDDEYELDRLHMDRLLPWMRLMFDEPQETPDTTEARQAYKKELYSVYTTIRSDFTQYQQWKQHNERLWVFSSYRKKNTASLAKKILADIRLFHEGLALFSMWGHFAPPHSSLMENSAPTFLSHGGDASVCFTNTALSHRK